MTYMVIIDGQASCYASTLSVAMRIAEQYIADNNSLRIEGRHEAEEHRAWVYDYRRAAWLDAKPQWLGAQAPPTR